MACSKSASHTGSSSRSRNRSANQHRTRMAGGSLVVDLRTDEVIELIDPRTPNAIPGAMAFAGSDSLFVSCSPPETIQFLGSHQSTMQMDCTLRDWPLSWHSSCRWFKGACGAPRFPQAMGCRDGSGGLVSRCCSDRDELCAFNPRTGDYIAGYSRHNYTFRSGLGGAVRIWNASGDRLTTFAAHRGNNWPNIYLDGSLYERRVSRHSRSKDSQGLGLRRLCHRRTK